MSAKDLLDKIQIKTPCEADWDAMIGNDSFRFCQHCNLTVHDLTQLTRKRARRLVAKSKGRLCVRYQRRPDGTMITKPVPKKLFHIGRRVSRVAAGAFSAALSLSSAVAATSSERLHLTLDSVAAVSQDPAPPAFLTVTIVGTITDAHGAVIQGAGISLGNVQSRFLSGTITNSEGEYKFEGVTPGAYRLKIEAPGFATNQVGIEIGANATVRVDQRLGIASIEEIVEVPAGEVVTLSGSMSMPLPSDPLVRAALEDDLDEVEALLPKSNVNLRAKETGATALEYAVRNDNREMVLALLRAGADIKSRNESKETLLMMLGEDATSDLVWDLIHAGVKVDLKDEDGDTALIQAAIVKNLDILTVLLHAGAKVDAKNDDGQTALMLAAGENLVKNIKALVAAGADINARDKEGKTALNYAKEGSHEKSIKLLQSYGAIEGEEIAK